VSPERDEREETEQRRRGAQDGKIGPLALGLDAEMRAGLLEGDLDLPAAGFSGQAANSANYAYPNSADCPNPPPPQ
jgi:hypothetical protein